MGDAADGCPSGAEAESLSDTEGAVYGELNWSELRSRVDGWAREHLGSAIATVRFRAGRIDAVWGVDLVDGRAVVIKAHRPPVDLSPLRAAVDAQIVLARAGFPCPLPLAGPHQVDGHVLTAETLVEGSMPDGREPAIRRLLAVGLARHIDLLRTRTDLAERAGPGPSWCQYQGGPWPVPHDTLVDFTSTVPAYDWLDAYGRRAADQILRDRDGAEVVVGHADWYAGNTVVVDGRLAGSFDWELVADTEAAIAGFAAACFASSPTGGGGLSTPAEAAAFLADYEQGRGRPLSEQEWRTAAGATAWILAFNARWQVALIDLGVCDQATVALVRDYQNEYLALARP